MSIRLKRMKELATKEAKSLKKEATNDELSRLHINSFNADDIHRCIYGLMTGNCLSERANILISKCAVRVYNTADLPDHSCSRADARLNGKPKKLQSNASRIFHYLSPIEMVIFNQHGGREAAAKIISFLKGETKTLNL